VLLRNIALAYPEAAETLSGNERLIKVRKRTFAVLRDDGNDLYLSVRLLASRPTALALPFVQPVLYRLGRSDWVIVRLNITNELPIELLWEWIDESYRASAPARLVRDLAPPPRALR
jgi:hypothetical protein